MAKTKDTQASEGTDKAKTSTGAEALRKDAMMAHLLDALDGGEHIGHHGQFVFASVARHFLSDDELVKHLAKDPQLGEDKARGLVDQVKERDYNPPGRERILEYQQDQDFQIIPNPDDPDAGNVYRSLDFPDHVYEHISEYREAKSES